MPKSIRFLGPLILVVLIFLVLLSVTTGLVYSLTEPSPTDFEVLRSPLLKLMNFEFKHKEPLSILCFGDSWTGGNAKGLHHALESKGVPFKLFEHTYRGYEASYFAKHPHLLPQAVADSGAKHVLLSMGGNDLKNIYWKKGRKLSTPWATLQVIENDLRTVLNALYEVYPHVKVVMYGYDFLGDVESWRPFAHHSPKWGGWMSSAYKMLGVRVLNYFSLKYGHLLKDLSTDYSKRGFHLHYVPLWGTLQAAHAANATLEHNYQELFHSWPQRSFSVNQPSPDVYMADPLHANDEGFQILMSALCHSYFCPAPLRKQHRGVVDMDQTVPPLESLLSPSTGAGVQ